MRHTTAILEPDTLSYVPAEAGRREAQKIKTMQRIDSFPTVRCPACRTEMLPRMTRGGPAFVCGCHTDN